MHSSHISVSYTHLNTNITNLEAEIKKADEEYADTFAELKVRLRSLYASGGNLTTLQILFDSTSLYDFSMRSEAMKTITKHDRELMEKIRLYRIQTQDQRDELNKEKEELADQKKDLEKKQEELQALEEENQKLIDELNVQSSETENDLAAAEAAKEDYVSQLDQLIADRNAQAEKEEEARRQAEANQNAANNNSGSGKMCIRDSFGAAARRVPGGERDGGYQSAFRHRRPRFARTNGILRDADSRSG